MRGVLKVMEGDRKRYAELHTIYDALLLEHISLKRTYLNLLDGHLEVVDGKNKTIKRLREKVKKQKEAFIMDLDDIQNLCTKFSDSEDYVNSKIEKWEK